MSIRSQGLARIIGGLALGVAACAGPQGAKPLVRAVTSPENSAVSPAELRNHPSTPYSSAVSAPTPTASAGVIRPVSCPQEVVKPFLPPITLDPPPRPLITAVEPLATRSCHEHEPPLLAALRAGLQHRSSEMSDLLRDQPNRDSLALLLPLTVRLSESPLEQAEPREIAGLVERLETLLGPLRARCGLRIGKICFCSKVRGFGHYEPFSEGRPLVSAETVQLYAEIQHFSTSIESEGGTNGERAYVVRLTSILEILDNSGKIRWTECFSEPDISRSPRQDFYQCFRFCVPDLPPGMYTLNLRITDDPTGRVAARAIELPIVGRKP